MVTGAVGVAAYEALRKMVVKAPLRAATVSVATGFNVDAVRAVAIEETVSIFFDASSTSPPLTRIPSSAPRPVPTMMAVGVARPNAHGHAMISTATAAVIPATGLAAISVHVEGQIEAESLPLVLSGMLYDDGVIDPRDTRTVLGMCLSAIANGPIKGTSNFGVFRM